MTMGVTLCLGAGAEAGVCESSGCLSLSTRTAKLLRVVAAVGLGVGRALKAVFAALFGGGMSSHRLYPLLPLLVAEVLRGRKGGSLEAERRRFEVTVVKSMSVEEGGIIFSSDWFEKDAVWSMVVGGRSNPETFLTVG